MKKSKIKPVIAIALGVMMFTGYHVTAYAYNTLVPRIFNNQDFELSN